LRDGLGIENREIAVPALAFGETLHYALALFG
jgi:hypothetical protein